jgi:hypothetical protein
MLPKTIFEDKRIGARVVFFPNVDRTSLCISGTWHHDFETLYHQYNCTDLWIYKRDGSELLEKALDTRLSDRLQLMGGFSNIRSVENADFLRGIILQLTDVKTSLDLSNLNLEELSTDEKFLKPGFLLPRSLKDLTIIGYNHTDLTPLQFLTNLQSLGIIRSRKLESLNGVEKLTELRTLGVWRATNLIDISALRNCQALTELTLDNCKSLGSIDAVGEITPLKKLSLESSGEIASLQPLTKLHDLEQLLFVADTNIKDGAIRQLINIPSLREVWFQNRRHYDITREDLMKLISISGG